MQIIFCAYHVYIPKCSSTSTLCRFLGTVKKVESTSASTCNIVVNFEDGSSDSYTYPHLDIEKLSSTKDYSAEFFPATFSIGDTVDAKSPKDGLWYRGRVANMNEDENTCDVLYYDKDVSLLYCFVLLLLVLLVLFGYS